jgi:hypothetical protein
MPDFGKRKGLKRFPFLPEAKKIQAESPVSGAPRRKCAQIRNRYTVKLPGFCVL